MANNPSPRAPLPSGPQPRGRTGAVALGSALVAGGVALFALISQGVIPGLNTRGISLPGGIGQTSTTQVQPNGTQPVNFSTYHDSQQRYALYVSSTWQHQGVTITINGQSVPAVTFTPNGSTLPNWTIALLSNAIADDQFTNVFGNAIQTQYGSTYTPTNGPNTADVGTNVWSRLDGMFDTGGQTVKVSAFTQTIAGHPVLVYYEALPIQFDNTQQQNFTPMLASLNVKS